MLKINTELKSYIAGFLDGDGCVMFQLIRRTDYRYGFQVKGSIVFYQKSNRKSYLEWLKTILKSGYIRVRKDGMAEYNIVELKSVMEILALLEPYVVLKKQHVKLAKNIQSLLSCEPKLEKLIEAAELVDRFGELNYSKRRTNTSLTLKAYLKEHNLYPRND